MKRKKGQGGSMMQTFRDLYIRRAAKADAGALQRLYHDYLGTHEAYESENITESIETDNIYVAVIGENHIIGTLTCSKVFYDPDRSVESDDGGWMIFMGQIQCIRIGEECICFDEDVKCEMRGLCVKDEYRHQGIASALLKHALNEEMNLSYALVWAPGGKIRAKDLWESNGFELQQVIKNLGAAEPLFCEKCVERTHGCNYCECYVYVERNREREG
jgi:ribosomal protein S18 acetylase RimI-like enzyme